MLGDMNKKIMTIDDLAVMIGKESQAAEKRFNVLEGKIEKMVIDTKEISADIKGIHKEINGIHADITEARNDLKAVDTRTAVIDLGIRMSKLEGSV
jgi:septation ring formation regulator EzrA